MCVLYRVSDTDRRNIACNMALKLIKVLKLNDADDEERDGEKNEQDTLIKEKRAQGDTRCNGSTSSSNVC